MRYLLSEEKRSDEKKVMTRVKKGMDEKMEEEMKTKKQERKK